MRIVLLLLIVAAPLLEIGLLVKIGQILGIWWTLAIVAGTGILGGAVLIDKGISAPLGMQQAILRGEAPLASMLDSALMAMAGVLLIFPGVISDALGLLLLIPPLRRGIGRFMVKSCFGIDATDLNGDGGRRSRRPPGTGPPDGSGPDSWERRARPTGSGPVIDGDFKVVDERTLDPNRRAPESRDPN